MIPAAVLKTMTWYPAPVSLTSTRFTDAIPLAPLKLRLYDGLERVCNAVTHHTSADRRTDLFSGVLCLKAERNMSRELDGKFCQACIRFATPVSSNDSNFPSCGEVDWK